MTSALRTSDRHMTVVQAAARSFALAGYHRTQMIDIADQAGVALGTLYRYATSKEELFIRALALGNGQTETASAAIGPIGDMEAFLVEYARSWFAGTNPRAHLFDDGEPIAFPDGVAAVYDGIAARHLAIRMLDRSAHDLPRLSEAYDAQVRGPALAALVSYLEHLGRTNRIRRCAHIEASSRLVLETCAWFAMHRHFSPGGVDIPDDVARQTALTHLTAAFQPANDRT